MTLLLDTKETPGGYRIRSNDFWQQLVVTTRVSYVIRLHPREIHASFY